MKAKAFQRRRKAKPGTAPGTLTATEGALPPVMRIVAYNKEEMIEEDIATVAEIAPYLEQWDTCWVNVDGLGDTGVIEELGRLFNLHPLALEDVVNTHQRPKVEDYDQTLFMVARMVTPQPGDLDLEQISLFLSKNFVVSFQERPGDCFEPVRERLRRGVGRRIRNLGADYLAYALIDAIIDSYFPLLESYGETLDEIEDVVMFKPTDDTMTTIHEIKRTLQGLRHVIWPLRDALSTFNAEHELVGEETHVFIRDALDHVTQLLDLLENFRERAASLMDLYLSALSHKMNEVMKVLTIIATIFMPLGFMAGLYGMNFDTSLPGNMPELSYPYAYPALLGAMLIVVMIMLYYFRRVGWLGRQRTKGLLKRRR